MHYIQNDSTNFTVMLLIQFYARVGTSLTCGKHLIDRTMSLKYEVIRIRKPTDRQHNEKDQVVYKTLHIRPHQVNQQFFGIFSLRKGVSERSFFFNFKLFASNFLSFKCGQIYFICSISPCVFQLNSGNRKQPVPQFVSAREHNQYIIGHIAKFTNLHMIHLVWKELHSHDQAKTKYECCLSALL